MGVLRLNLGTPFFIYSYDPLSSSFNF